MNAWRISQRLWYSHNLPEDVTLIVSANEGLERRKWNIFPQLIWLIVPDLAANSRDTSFWLHAILICASILIYPDWVTTVVPSHDFVSVLLLESDAFVFTREKTTHPSLFHPNAWIYAPSCTQVGPVEIRKGLFWPTITMRCMWEVLTLSWTNLRRR